MKQNKNITYDLYHKLKVSAHVSIKISEVVEREMCKELQYGIYDVLHDHVLIPFIENLLNDIKNETSRI